MGRFVLRRNEVPILIDWLESIAVRPSTWSKRCSLEWGRWAAQVSIAWFLETA